MSQANKQSRQEEEEEQEEEEQVKEEADTIENRVQVP